MTKKLTMPKALESKINELSTLLGDVCELLDSEGIMPKGSEDLQVWWRLVKTERAARRKAIVESAKAKLSKEELDMLGLR